MSGRMSDADIYTLSPTCSFEQEGEGLWSSMPVAERTGAATRPPGGCSSSPSTDARGGTRSNGWSANTATRQECETTCETSWPSWSERASRSATHEPSAERPAFHHDERPSRPDRALHGLGRVPDHLRQAAADQASARRAEPGARPSTREQAEAVRAEVCGVSERCAGEGCLQRSIATVLLCRLDGHAPNWCSGYRTGPFVAHAWVEADGMPVSEPLR